MAFRPAPSQVDFVRLEERILSFWQKNEILKKTEAQRAGAPEFVFYEGPPTANGRPGVHHVLARVYKDIFPRYRTMQGYHVLRRGGWDTHGLPVEIEVEKQLDLASKREIEAYGIARFNELCRRSVFTYIQEWEGLTDRIAYWVDLQDAYVTYTNEYIESVWWILKSFWDRDLLYQREQVAPYCPRCGTALSDHEVALGYAETEDPSLIVRLPLVDEADTSLLIWTTTPWTLPGNVAVAAHPEEIYVTVERAIENGSRERLIVARARMEAIFGDENVRVVETFKGKHLKGRRYQPLYTFLPPDRPAYFILMEDFVSTEEGTGLVHLAPAFGAEDMQVAREHDLSVLVTIEADGTFIPDISPWRGRFVKTADPLIIQDLDARGLLLRGGTHHHTYPFCWRCDTPLLYFVRSTWYLKTTDFKDRLIGLNREIHWVPEHVQEGRFGNWLENNVDWALGRERYWGTPLPIWRCDRCEHTLCVGSIEELSKLAGRDLSDLDLHRPAVDQVVFPCPECDPDRTGEMRRVEEILDVWFDSGAMPMAQWHYPFENQILFERQFPADFICEAVDQTRGWFYSLHAISTLLWDRPAYRNVISLGLILDAEGQKMSKSRGNVVDPWEVINAHGADAFRWYFYSASPPGRTRRFSVDQIGEVVRSFTLTLWNVYSFFTTYAAVDGWDPSSGPAPDGDDLPVLDRWLRSELHVLIRDVTAAMDAYDAYEATRRVEAFVDLLSRWYIRRSRRRFWKGQSDAAKESAYHTLYEVLVALTKLLAPAMPFLAEEIYQNLVVFVERTAPQSVHLAAWPESNPAVMDEDLNAEMQLVMKLASLGHAAREGAGVKVRQPLSEAAFLVGNAAEAPVVLKYASLLSDELNVRTVRTLDARQEAVSYRLNPLPERLGPKYESRFPAVREAILELAPDPAARALLDGESISVHVHGELLEILPEEVEVHAVARTGQAIASEGPYLAALDTVMTPELEREGQAREIVRRIQVLRKDAGLDIADRIVLFYRAAPALHAVLDGYRDYIQEEVLAVQMSSGSFPEGIFEAVVTIGGEKLTLGIRKAETTNLDEGRGGGNGESET